jgi:hypothetical protein
MSDAARRRLAELEAEAAALRQQIAVEQGCPSPAASDESEAAALSLDRMLARPRSRLRIILIGVGAALVALALFLVVFATLSGGLSSLATEAANALGQFQDDGTHNSP